MLRNEALGSWIKKVAKDAEHVLSVCNGALVLGRLGLLDGLQQPRGAPDQRRAGVARHRAPPGTGHERDTEGVLELLHEVAQGRLALAERLGSSGHRAVLGQSPQRLPLLEGGPRRAGPAGCGVVWRFHRISRCILSIFDHR